MDQLEKLLVVLTPAALLLVTEQVTVYRRDLGVSEGDEHEKAWCDRVSEAARHTYADKTAS